MNLVAKIRSLQAQVDELRAAHLALSEAFRSVSELVLAPYAPLTQPIDATPPIASATIAPPPARRRGRPPKPKV